ncbi:MAG TPA: hypothetical protein VIM64_25310 [Puia sp.]
MAKLGGPTEGVGCIVSILYSVASLFEIGLSRLCEEINTIQTKPCGLLFDSLDKDVANAKTSVAGRYGQAPEKAKWRV